MYFFIYKWRKKANLEKKQCKIYQNLSEEEKEKKRQYHCDWNKNFSEEYEQTKVEYMRNYYQALKKKF